MRIAVNARFLNSLKPDGIARYSYEILRRMTVLHPMDEFIFFFDRQYRKDLIFSKNITPVVIGLPARHPVLWYIWFEFFLASALKKYKPDVFFSPDGFMPLKTDVPTLIVIHDINFFHRPMDLPFCSRKYYNHFFPEFARKAGRISTVSEYSKQDIEVSYGIERSKIKVHYNGVNDEFKPLRDDEKILIRKRYTGGWPFFIFAGSIHPRKNLAGLLKAFDHFRSSVEGEFKLVVTGEKLFRNRTLNRFHMNMKYRRDVIFTGFLSSARLCDLMAASEALAFVPFYEGFGLPVLEAMMAEVPVIASGVTSLPEVAGNAAIYADPSDYLSISDAMKTVAFSPRIKQELITNGRFQREKYKWEFTVEGLWQTIESLKNA